MIQESNGKPGISHINITFKAVECPRCHIPRVATQPCPDCGMRPDPREADPIHQRRVALVAAVLAALDAPALADEALELSEAMGEAADLPRALLEGLAKASPEYPNPAQLIDAVVRLRQLREWAAHDAPRPWRNHKRDFRDLLQFVEHSVRKFLDAFRARTPLEAQRLAAAAQRDLDAAAASAVAISERLDAVASLADTGRHNWLDALSRVATGLALRSSGEPLLTVAAAAEADIKDLTGATTVSPGTALSAALLIAPARGFYDYENTKKITLECLTLLRTDANRFRALAASRMWRESEARARQLALEAVDSLLVVLDAEALTSRQAVRSLLLHIQDTVEGPVRHLAATLIAVRTGEPYDDLVTAYPTALLSRLASLGGAAFAAGFDATLRNASAHLDFDVDELQEEIVLSVRKNPRRMSMSGFGDALLAVAEAASAAAVSVAIAADELDIDLPTPDLTDFGVSAEALPPAILRLIGWEDVTVFRRDPAVVIEARGVQRALVPTTAALLETLPEHITHLEFKVTDEDGRSHTFHTPLAPFRAFHGVKQLSTDSVEARLSYAVALAACTLDGAPAVSREAIRHYLAMQVGEKLAEPLAVAIQRVKAVRNAALALHDTDAVAVLDGTMTALRLQAQGLPVDSTTKQHLNTLAKWEQDRHKNALGALA